MVMTDPVADMLTRIRNAKVVRHPMVEIPASFFKEEIVKVFVREGFVEGYERVNASPVDLLKVKLKYKGRRECAISGLRRMSTPGRRIYVGVKDMPTVMNGLGVAVLSTPTGVLTDAECRRKKVGGEVLCYIW